ncbi:MAG: mechanosensitive ion channel family protein [Muribaculaceae bacterium]|nr:mechanosensitive ion channel family protein [Muribaculaceae bacterium]
MISLSISFVDFQTLLEKSLTFPGSSIVITLLLLIAIAISSVAGYYITLLVLKGVAWLVEWTDTDWDDDLYNKKFQRALSQLAPAVIVAIMLPKCFKDTNTLASVINILTDFYIIAVSCHAINTLIDNLHYAFAKRDAFRKFAIKGIFQMAKLIVIGMGIIIAVSILVGKTPIAILTTLGASAAILMLVFKDTVLGLVASVQLTANNMLKKGDWIMVDKHKANGEVVDISLTTVKVKNWDNSVTTVPPYSLVSESFQNFQAMRDDHARRVMRSIFIDAASVRFLTNDELAMLREKGWLEGIDEEDIDMMVNLRIFRHYLENWLSKRPEVRSDLLFMVRQMAPTPSGLPLDIYFYTHETRWKPFEHIQSDIFDHVYAVVGSFGLRIFQTPSGHNMEALGNYHSGLTAPRPSRSLNS